jgi:hypothetical protein
VCEEGEGGRWGGGEVGEGGKGGEVDGGGECVEGGGGRGEFRGGDSLMEREIIYKSNLNTHILVL